MQSNNIITVYTSRKKAFLLILGSCAFVALGIWIIQKPNVPIIKLIIGGYGSVLFFGFGIFAGIKQLIDRNKGLIISARGLHINPMQRGDTFFSWEDIKGFSETSINHTKLITIHVESHAKRTTRGNSLALKGLMKGSTLIAGSPYNLTANIYEINHKELLKLLQESHTKYTQAN